MQKTLFISDLDGTLFDPTGKLTARTVEIVNRLIDGGMNFTFATARTIYSAKPLTDALHINVPCILNNGASVYDIGRGEYVKNAYIPTDTAEKLVRAFHDNGVRCFVFKFVDGVLSTCYDNAENDTMRAYIAERRGKFEQPFIKCGNVLECLDGSQIYINSTGNREKLLPVKNTAAELENADCAFYEDNYTKDWYLETFSAEASKANGIRFLREKYGFERVVAFGDNLNDLSMFSQADVKIAVENAQPEVKKAADIVIGGNDSDGVAEYLLNNI